MKSNTPKKLVRVKDVPYQYIDPNIFEGSLEEICKKVKSIKKELKATFDKRQKEYPTTPFTPFKNYEKISLVIDEPYGEGFEITLKVERYETDEELNERVRINQKKSEAAKIAAQNRKLAEEKRQRTLFETLKKKFGQV